jgi:hypothetical protein
VSGISLQEAVREEEDQKEGRLGAGQDAKTRDQNFNGRCLGDQAANPVYLSHRISVMSVRVKKIRF